MFMAVAVTVLRTLARTMTDPAEILVRLNDELADQNPRGMFVTIQCLVFDLTKGEVAVPAPATTNWPSSRRARRRGWPSRPRDARRA